MLPSIFGDWVFLWRRIMGQHEDLIIKMIEANKNHKTKPINETWAKLVDKEICEKLGVSHNDEDPKAQVEKLKKILKEIKENDEKENKA